jgi:pimeloyl-ACP methyl ester carboxylesterase
MHPGLPIPQDILAHLRKVRAGRKLVELSSGNQIQPSFGKIEDFNAPRFTSDAAKLGLWEPMTFLGKYGTGIYFQEPYDPARIPVLFVHGANGSGGDWKPFVAMLDKTKYQFWIYSYPSGLRIQDSARILQTVVARLHERYGFKRLDVIAHSMGGLVSRKFVLDTAEGGNAPYLCKYITLSTPWAGHEAAGLGVKHGPAVIPCWLDLQPNSEFQAQLFRRTLPDSIEHYLAFSFHGSSVIALPESNDGVVSILSELAPSAQEQAHAMRGFDVTHRSILTSREAADWVSGILDAPLPKKK